MRSNQKTIAFWAFFAVLAILLFQHYHDRQKPSINQFDYNKYQNALANNQIVADSVVVEESSNTLRGKIKPEFEAQYNGTEFQIEAPAKDALEVSRKYGINPSYSKGSDSAFLQGLLWNILPIAVVVVLFMFVMKQIQAGGGKAMSFGKSRAKLLTENKLKVLFKDVAGVEEAKEELEEIVSFLKDPKKYTRLGGRIPKGVLLVGPPGTGKTLLARAVAGEAGVPFFTISGSDFVEMFVGVGASRVRDLFEQGKKNAPCLIFIDEIDAVGRHRGAGMGGGHDEREQTLNQLLVEMDGFESNEGVILIAATNRPDVLDPALLRPGRFDRRVVVNTPDREGRLQILKVHAKKLPLASDVNLDQLAKGTPGFSGADLENLINEGALIAARKDQSRVTQLDLEHAKDKVMMGAERKSMVISDEDKRNTAYHEAGHAIVAKFLPKTDPVHKVTIIPRGMALGLTQFLPKEDTRNLTKLQAESLISVMFGGRTAEELIFKDFTTGASNDIERATELARRMVCEWGMSETLGPLAYEKREGPVFLGMQSGQAREYSDTKALEIDREIYRIVHTSYEKAKTILSDNESVLHVMAQALLEYETIDGEEVDLIVSGAKIEDIRSRRLEITQRMLNEQAQGHEDLKVKEKTLDTTGADPMGAGPVTA